MIKKETFWAKVKRNWRNILIVILIYLLVSSVYANIQFRDEVKNSVYEYQLNLTQTLGDYGATHDCFDRGTMECYEKGTVNCYGK
jgi:hypothetical protein